MRALILSKAKAGVKGAGLGRKQSVVVPGLGPGGTGVEVTGRRLEAPL